MGWTVQNLTDDQMSVTAYGHNSGSCVDAAN